MPIYLQYDSGSIKGDVTEGGHKDWIEVNSFQWGVGRGISSPTGSSADRESSAPSVSEVTVTKQQDVSTIGLLTEAYHGLGKKAVFEFCRTDKGKLDVYLKVELEDVLISGYSVSSGGDRPSESLSLNFTKITVFGTQMDKAGKNAEKSNIAYDVGLAKTV